jgi:hypothetical protein
LAPISRTTSAFSTSITGLLTAPEPMPSSSAATLDAWHRRVQWSTLLLPKPVRTSFWNRYASSLLPLAEPKPASALGRACRGCRERAGGERHRLVPRRFAEHRQRIGGSIVKSADFGNASRADQRLGQPVRVRHVVEAEAALDAEPLVIRGSVAAFDVDDLVAAHVVR